MQFNSQTNMHNTQLYCLVSPVPQIVFEELSFYEN